MTTRRLQSLASRTRARFDGSALRARMSPTGIRQQIRRADAETQGANWPTNSTSTSDLARALDEATQRAGDNDPGARA